MFAKGETRAQSELPGGSVFEQHSNVPRAEIVTIGNEIVSGLIADGNARFLCGRLQQAGWVAARVTAVGDDPEIITQAVREALDRAALVITTGGLGSTHDDITKNVLAKLFDSGFRRDEKVAENLARIFKNRGKAIPDSIVSQTQVPEKATILYNDKGTAPGFRFERDGKAVCALPGIPLEMQHLFEKYIAPELARPGGPVIVHRMLNTTGLTESDLWSRVGPLTPIEAFATVASLPSHLGVRVRLSATDTMPEAVKAKLDAAETLLREKIGADIFGVDQETLEGRVGALLKEKHQTLAVAESCTGGLIGHRLTQVPGSSGYFLEGAVTYSNDAKMKRLGVQETVLREKGAVSPETALAMAEGVRAAAGADYGLSVTGIAGPDGGSEAKPVGLTYIAVADAEGTEFRKYRFHQDRGRNKERAAQAALNLLRQRIMKTRT